MKKKVVVVLLAMLGTLGIGYSQEAPRIAVSTFDTKGNVSKDDADIITEVFITNLVSQGVNVIDRANFDKIMSEMKFQTSDWSDSAKTSELGKVLNATAIIRGQIMQTPSNVIITVTLLDVKTAKILSSATETAKDLQYLYTKYYSNYSSRDYIMELCKTIKEKIPEPEPIIGTWMAQTDFRNDFEGLRIVGYIGFAWNDDSVGTRISPKTIGDCVITFNNDGTLQISKLTYPVVEITCPKIRQYQQKESLKEVSGSGFWQINNIKDGIREYFLKIVIDGNIYSMRVYAKKNPVGVYNVYTPRGDGLKMKEGVLFAPVTTKTNVGTYKNPEWKYSITDKIEDRTSTRLELINWVKTNEYKEEEKSK
ncbi:MAG: hypothetical protein K2H67_07995 [Treponemataceae bacterium]|nr:hypothetical protein [Treponemataceae bacterium]